jgi:hypothetical protein
MSELGHPIERLGLSIMSRPNPSEASATRMAANAFSSSMPLANADCETRAAVWTRDAEDDIESAACARDIDRCVLALVDDCCGGCMCPDDDAP